MRVLVLLPLLLLALATSSSPSMAEACQLQNVRTVDKLLICIYNCNGKIVTLTRPGGVCPVILE